MRPPGQIRAVVFGLTLAALGWDAAVHAGADAPYATRNSPWDMGAPMDVWREFLCAEETDPMIAAADGIAPLPVELLAPAPLPGTQTTPTRTDPFQLPPSGFGVGLGGGGGGGSGGGSPGDGPPPDKPAGGPPKGPEGGPEKGPVPPGLPPGGTTPPTVPPAVPLPAPLVLLLTAILGLFAGKGVARARAGRAG